MIGEKVRGGLRGRNHRSRERSTVALGGGQGPLAPHHKNPASELDSV